MAKTLITGCAGFIGFHLCRRLLGEGGEVLGIDNLNAYYDPALKRARLAELNRFSTFQFHLCNLEDCESIGRIFRDLEFDVVVNLAAQAGVRYSLKDPHAYVNSNIAGFLNILEACRQARTKHLVFASSSSVYGANVKMPFSVRDNVDHPVSLYAATKKSNELMAHAYAHLFSLPVTGLRFFTVYGPWGRPDMALFLFTKAILAGEPVEVFNGGDMRRDFTYIDDVVESVVRIMAQPPACRAKDSAANPDVSAAPYRIYNVGRGSPAELMDFVRAIEACTGRQAALKMLPMQPGDVPETYAEIDDLIRETGFVPAISIEEGVRRFVEWYRAYYNVQTNQPGEHP